MKRSTYSKTENKEAVVQFDVEWIDPCLQDEVTTASTIEDIVYQIGVTEPITETLRWSQTYSICALDLNVSILDGSFERSLT